MSLDLLVFDAELVEYSNCAEFVEWYEESTRWSESIDYNDSSRSSIRIQAWFGTIREEFPAMNGPFSVADERLDDAGVTDYSFLPDAVYVTLSYEIGADGFRAFVETSYRSGLGVYFVSGDQSVWAPNSNSEFVQVC